MIVVNVERCGRCPFAGKWSCGIMPEETGNFPFVAPWKELQAPDWCPLKLEPVTVQFVPEKETP